jgi:hypothetical protein
MNDPREMELCRNVWLVSVGVDIGGLETPLGITERIATQLLARLLELRLQLERQLVCEWPERTLYGGGLGFSKFVFAVINIEAAVCILKNELSRIGVLYRAAISFYDHRELFWRPVYTSGGVEPVSLESLQSAHAMDVEFWRMVSSIIGLPKNPKQQ